MGLDTTIYYKKYRASNTELVIEEKPLHSFRNDWFWPSYFNTENCEPHDFKYEELVSTEEYLQDILNGYSTRDIFFMNYPEASRWFTSCIDDTEVKDCLIAYRNTIANLKVVMNSEEFDPEYDKITLVNWW